MKLTYNGFESYEVPMDTGHSYTPSVHGIFLTGKKKLIQVLQPYLRPEMILDEFS